MKFFTAILLAMSLMMSFAQSAEDTDLPTSQSETDSIRGVVLPVDAFIDEVSGQIADPTWDEAWDNLRTPVNSDDQPIFEITFDPDQGFRSRSLSTSLSELRRLSKKMRSHRYKSDLATHVFIPLSTSKPELLENLVQLENSVIQRFLDRKEFILKKFAKSLLFLQVSKNNINNSLEALNNLLFSNPKLVAEAKNLVVTPALFGAHGIGFNDALMKALEEKPLFRFLPSTGGYYVALSGGLSFIYSLNKDGKNRFRLRPGIDLRLGRKFYSPFFILAGGLAMTFSIENEDSGIMEAKFIKTSVPTFLGGPDLLGFTIPAGIGVPGGVLAGLEGSFTRVQVTPQNVPVLKNTIHRFLNRVGESCKKLANRIRQK